MTHLALKAKAVKLRSKGYSYNLISEKIGITKSTLHYWLANVPYAPNKEVLARIGVARAKSGEVKHQLKLATFRLAEEQALSDIPSLSKRDLFILGIGIYIGEGEKTGNVCVINSDPRIINLAIRWFKEICEVTTENLTLAIHLYPDNNRASCLKFWSETTGIPLSQFGKTQIDKRVGKRLGKRGKLPYGTAHLRVKSNGNKELGVRLSRKINAWMNRVLDMRV